jgi:hypothetical protein
LLRRQTASPMPCSERLNAQGSQEGPPMWPFKRRPSEGRAKAEKALEEARKDLHKVERRGDEVSTIAGALKDIREQNGFGEALDRILNGDGGNQ